MFLSFSRLGLRLVLTGLTSQRGGDLETTMAHFAPLPIDMYYIKRNTV